MAQHGGRRPGAGRKKGSRNRATAEEIGSISELARMHAKDAIDALVSIAKKGESEAARVSAANALLDRGYGRAPQSHQHTGPAGGPIQTMDVTNLSDEQLAALEAAFGGLADGPDGAAEEDPG